MSRARIESGGMGDVGAEMQAGSSGTDKRPSNPNNTMTNPMTAITDAFIFPICDLLGIKRKRMGAEGNGNETFDGNSAFSILSLSKNSVCHPSLYILRNSINVE